MSLGVDPMCDRRSGADAPHVMRCTARYTEGEDFSDRLPAARRFGRDSSPHPGGQDPVDETRTDRVTQMRKQVRDGAYCVDPHAVAEAIIDRLREGGSVSAGARNRSSPRRPPAR